MAKYYVESGPSFQVVVQASSFIDAMAKAFELMEPEAPLCLADVVIVNQQGFVWDREDHQLHGHEIVIPTRLVLGEPETGDTNERTRIQ